MFRRNLCVVLLTISMLNVASLALVQRSWDDEGNSANKD